MSKLVFLMDMKGKNIVVTGASSGIGKCLVEYLSSYEGVKIVAVARRIELIKEKEQVVFPFQADLSLQEGVDALFEFAESKLGKIDVFIANAGFAFVEKLGKADWKHISDIFNLNVFSTIYSLQKFSSQSNADSIRFVSVVSGVAYFPLPGYALYCSTKSALKMFFEAYDFEKEKKLSISCVYPVATRTDFFDKAAHGTVSLPFLTQGAEEVASKIIKGIEKNKKNIYPSLLFRVFLPLARAFPFLIHLYSLNEKRKVHTFLDA